MKILLLESNTEVRDILVNQINNYLKSQKLLSKYRTTDSIKKMVRYLEQLTEPGLFFIYLEDYYTSECKTLISKIKQKDIKNMIVLFADDPNERVGVRFYYHNKIHEFNMRLKDIMPLLDDRFYRCHKLYIINMDKFEAISYSIVFLHGGFPIPLSRLRRGQLVHG